jgi:hypothetical protein
MSLTFRFSVTKAQKSCSSLFAACFQTLNRSLVNQLPLQISGESLDEGVSLQPHLFPSKDNAYSISQCDVLVYLHINRCYASVFEPPKLKTLCMLLLTFILQVRPTDRTGLIRNPTFQSLPALEERVKFTLWMLLSPEL